MAGIIVKKLNENLAKNAVGQYLQEGLKQQRNLKFNMTKNNELSATKHKKRKNKKKNNSVNKREKYQQKQTKEHIKT